MSFLSSDRIGEGANTCQQVESQGKRSSAVARGVICGCVAHMSGMLEVGITPKRRELGRIWGRRSAGMRAVR